MQDQGIKLFIDGTDAATLAQIKARVADAGVTVGDLPTAPPAGRPKDALTAAVGISPG